MKKILSNVIATIATIILIWYALSYVEILCKHGNHNPQYSDKNIIIKTIDWGCELHGIEQ